MTEPSLPLVDGYEVLELIGKGSMGSVWLARQISMNRLVALKILHAEVTTHKELIQRFVREARVCATLDHPNLIRVHDVVKVGSGWALVMEYVPGTTLAEAQKKRGRLPEEEVRQILLQALEALGYLHSKGIAHRDVKPDNLMIMDSGQVKLADLGLARRVDMQKTLTAIDEILGTPAYMAPEQMHNAHAAGKLCDYYSLGATAWHLLAGRAPYEAPSAVDILMALEKGPPADLTTLVPGISIRMSRTVAALMARDPAKRPQSHEDAKRLVEEGPPRVIPTKRMIQAAGGLLAFVALSLVMINLQDDTPGNAAATQDLPSQIPVPHQESTLAPDAAKDMLAKALLMEDPRERIPLLEAILREYPDTDVAPRCSEALATALEQWNLEERRRVEEMTQGCMAAIAERQFQDARAGIDTLQSTDMSHPWVRDKVPGLVKDLNSQLAAATSRCLEEALDSSERQGQKGLWRESLRILKEAQTLLPGEPRLELRLKETQQKVAEETRMLQQEIDGFVSGDLKRLCRQRRYADIRKKAEDWAFHPLSETRQSSLDDLKALSQELGRHEEIVEGLYELKLELKVQVPGQSGILQGTVVRHNQRICLKLSEKLILPVISAADPRHIARYILDASPTPDDLFRSALYARFVAQDEPLYAELMALYSKATGEGAKRELLPQAR